MRDGRPSEASASVFETFSNLGDRPAVFPHPEDLLPRTNTRPPAGYARRQHAMQTPSHVDCLLATAMYAYLPTYLPTYVPMYLCNRPNYIHGGAFHQPALGSDEDAGAACCAPPSRWRRRTWVHVPGKRCHCSMTYAPSPDSLCLFIAYHRVSAHFRHAFPRPKAAYRHVACRFRLVNAV